MVVACRGRVMHMVLIKRGRIHGYQLRWGEHARGQTAYFGVRKHGGEEPARAAALERAREIDEPWSDRPPRKPVSRRGELVSSQPCSIDGLRWEWRREDDGEIVFYVAAVWISTSGRESSSSSSTKTYGVDGAVQRAIEALTKHKAPRVPRKRRAIAAARAEQERGPTPLLSQLDRPVAVREPMQLALAA